MPSVPTQLSKAEELQEHRPQRSQVPARSQVRNVVFALSVTKMDGE